MDWICLQFERIDNDVESDAPKTHFVPALYADDCSRDLCERSPGTRERMRYPLTGEEYIAIDMGGGMIVDWPIEKVPCGGVNLGFPSSQGALIIDQFLTNPTRSMRLASGEEFAYRKLYGEWTCAIIPEQIWIEVMREVVSQKAEIEGRFREFMRSRGGRVPAIRLVRTTTGDA